MSEPSVVVTRPARAPRCPVVASIPHSGLHVPPAIAAMFTDEQRAWLRNTDWHLDQLYDFLPELGVATLVATHSRYVVDVNRDPGRRRYGPFFESVLAETTAHGRPVYARPPGAQEIAERIERYHAPYHAALAGLLADRRREFGHVLLLDLHSFMGPITDDVCLGDRDGGSCGEHVTARFEQALKHTGFGVVRNRPFRGGYILAAHAGPPAVHALQIELRYTNYLDGTHLDEPMRPPIDAARLATCRARLHAAFERALATVLPGLDALPDRPREHACPTTSCRPSAAPKAGVRTSARCRTSGPGPSSRSS